MIRREFPIARLAVPRESFRIHSSFLHWVLQFQYIGLWLRGAAGQDQELGLGHHEVMIPHDVRIARSVLLRGCSHVALARAGAGSVPIDRTIV